MKKVLTYFSLFTLLCSIFTAPMTVFSQTVAESSIAQSSLNTDTLSDVGQNQTAVDKKQEGADNQVTVPQNENSQTVAQEEVAVQAEAKEVSNNSDVMSRANVTGTYTSQITDADKQEPPYFGGSIITLYNGISVSGNVAQLDEGAYTVISLPKASFDKPSASGISTSFVTFKNLEITETDTDWKIITTYKALSGGYSADTPFKINLTPRQVINGSTHTIQQEFYSADGTLLANSDYTVTAKAVIETPYNVNQTVERLKTQVDDDYVIKEGQTFAFNTSNLGVPSSNQSDPRDRRVFATIPEGTKVKDGDGWVKVEGTDNQYYKDIKRDQLNTASVKIELDLSGMDLSANDDSNKAKAIRVDFSIQPVVNGEVQTDIPAKTWYVQRNFYVLKKEPEVPTYPVSSGISTSNSFTFLDDAYAASKAGASLYIPYNIDELNSKGRQTQQVVSSHSINYKKNEKDPVKFVIKSSTMTVSNYIDPTQLKINVVGLSDENSAKLINKLNGTKAYGVKSDGTKVLISENIAVESSATISASFTKDGWTTFTPAEYKSILFEYSGDGLEFDKAEYDANLYKSLYTSVVGNVKSKISEDLKKQLPNAPKISQTDSASTSAETYVHSNDTDDTITMQANSRTASATEVYLLQYDQIQRYNNTTITNGNAFYTDDTVSVRIAYSHTRNGNAAAGVIPKNLNVYYLVPDGLEPLDNSDVFDSVSVIPAYTPGYNLVVAKPKSIDVPNNTDIITQTTTNYYTMNFKVNSRLPIGSYTIRSAIAIDNNKFNVSQGSTSGIIQFDTPSSVWSNITKNADNRSDDPMRFTDLSFATLNVYPNKVLVAYKSVKLASESDASYASSLGQKGKVGSEINYQLKLVNNSTRDIDEFTLIDKMPYVGDKSIVPNQDGNYNARGSLFSTPLTGPVTSDVFDIYYTTDVPKETITDLKDMNWVNSVDDYSKVTAIKATLKSGQVIQSEATVSITLNSQIENLLTIEDGDKAFNSFAYSLNNGNTFIESLSAEVIANYDKKDVILNKLDGNHPDIKLAHAIFELYQKNSDKLVQSNMETNVDGQVVMKNLIIGKSYYLKEVQAPDGYNKLESPIHFTVTEDLATFDVINYKDENITISGRKIWDDGNNQDGKRPDSIKVNLLANGEQVDEQEVTSQTDWTYTFEDVPKYKDGKEIVYTVTENSVTDYSTKINGFDITNSYTPAVTSVTVTKQWDDANNKDQIRPDSVQVYLLANGQKQGEWIELSEANQWQFTWQNLPEKSDGQAITYTIEEVKVDGYTASVNDQDKGNIILTNTHLVSQMTISGTKTWDDANNAAGKRPDSITVNLLADGKKVTSRQVTADQNGKWQYEFKDMPKVVNGKTVVYTVEENSVKHYTAVVSGFDITNKYTPETLPQTGETYTHLLSIFGLVILAALASYTYLKKHRNRSSN